MKYKAWIAVAVAGFTIGAGVSGLQNVITGDAQPTASADNSQQAGNQQPGSLSATGTGDFQIPADGAFTLPDGPITLQDGTVVEIDPSGGTITRPDGTTIAVPARPQGGFSGRFGGQPGQ